MAHGGYGKRRVAERQQAGRRRPKSLGVDKKAKPKAVSVKNQIRSIERMLRKDLPPAVKEAQEKKLDGLKKLQEEQNRKAMAQKMNLRYRKIRFFERRKIERRIRRVERQLRALTGEAREAELAEQLSKSKEDLLQDLEYVRFFPKDEEYVPLFTGGEGVEITEKRNSLRKLVKAKLVDAAANGRDVEETGSEEDGLLDPSDDDFFLSGSSSDDADADDEGTDKSIREQASSASGKAASGMSSDERNQRQISARALMPPPRPSKKSFHGSSNDKRVGKSWSKKPAFHKPEMSTSSNTSNSIGFRNRRSSDPVTGNSDNVSSNSDARKPRRKRRPKKKNKQA
ncbi:OLC1v1019874C1 [Oldenlandia corymbosa var. corymbosa]|uniref:rRNA-processing protein EFG1 n=1 Tax=Oldenlandia corymbosa var. corymbosa TaxID=529605 RepID=A0AAV1EF14_OLDCO|nr:OLC1v1019874C1 [Oldenlandia corymbosa var. corymbosa]